MTEDELRRLAASVSNVGRWGPDDELGTLNYLTPETRREALALIRECDVVPLGKPLAFSGGGFPPSAQHLMTVGSGPDVSAQDVMVLNPHGYEMTHLDAVGHSYFDGQVWNGRVARDVVSGAGLAFGSVKAAAGGIVTRGVLLDLPVGPGTGYLGAGAGVSARDLEACETRQGVRAGSGDAVFVRVGLDLREAVEGPSDTREGVLPDVLGWLHRRQVAIYSGDCIERQPSGLAAFPVPVHQVGMAIMGLWFLDNPDVERLAEACRARGRFEFCLVVAPLVAGGATASPVNPLALF